MARVRQYVGARYVPKFMDEYNPSISYEALCVVDNGMGSSFISGKPTPAGTPLSNRNYWHPYGAYSGAVINLQDQIDELSAIVESGYVNVLTLGVKNDGSIDCSSIINDNADKPLYFPKGVYRFDSPLTLSNSIKGDGVPRSWRPGQFDGTVFKFNITSNDTHILYDSSVANKSIDFGNLLIECDATNTGKVIYLNTNEVDFAIHDLDIVNAHIGIHVNPTIYVSGYVFVDTVRIWGPYGSPVTGSKGVIIEEKAFDSKLHNIECLGLQHGIEVNASNISIDGGHIWAGGGTHSTAYYNNTICIRCNASGLRVSNMYLDTAVVPLSCSTTAKMVFLTNVLIYWGDWSSYTGSGYYNSTVFYFESDKTKLYSENVFITMPFGTWYLSNHKENIIGQPVINGIGNNTTYTQNNAVKLIQDSAYALAVKVADGALQEVARVSKNDFVIIINSGSTTVLARGISGTYTFCSIGNTVGVFVKIVNNDYAAIYIRVQSDGIVQVRSLTDGVADLDKTLFNGEPIVLEKQADTTGLTPATRFYYENP